MKYLLRCTFIPLFVVIFTTGALAQSDSYEASYAHYQTISNMSESQLYRQAQKFCNEGDIDSMLIYYNVLFNRYTQHLNIADKRLCALALLESGITYYEQFNYSKAMELLLDCQRICEDNRFSDLLADVYRSIGNVYCSHSDFERGILFYVKSLEKADLINDKALKIKVLNNLVGACSFDGRFAEAKRYYDDMSKISSDDPLYRYDLYVDGGLIAAAEDNVDEAIKNYKAAADYATAQGMGVKYSGAAYSCLSNLYRKIGQTDSALRYLHINELAARDEQQNDLLSETLRGLSELYREQGNVGRAQRYQTEYLDLSDKIFNQREFNSLKNAEFMYELNKSTETISRLNQQKIQKDVQISSQRRMLWSLSVGTLIVMTLFIIIYRQNGRLSKAYNDLYDKNKANLENEKSYLARLHELEAQLESARATQPDELLSDEWDGERQSAGSDIPGKDKLQGALEKSIMGVMDQTDVLFDPDFSINRLAEMVGSNSTYVSRVINEMYGKNFRTVLNECRIKESMKRLSDWEKYGNYTIKAIAESVGYKSQSNFIAVFTKYTGIKPSMYQKIASERN